MSNITRIQNNQITDSTITSQKIAAGTLVGTNFSNNLTLTSNVTIVGNLAVSGNSSTINSINTYVQDPLVELNAGYAGSVSGYDIGLLVNRNLSSLGPYGSVNTAWVWVENDQAFESIATATVGNALTGLTSVGFANLKTGNATMVSASVTNNLTAGGITGTPISGSTGYFTTAQATNFSSGNVLITGGSISGIPISASTLYATNFSTGNAVISGGYISSLANATITSGLVTTLVATNFSTANAVITGGSITGTPISGSTGYFTTAQATNFSSANAVITGGSLNSTPIGATTASTGAFTTLTASGVTTANGNLVAASGTASNNTTTGALVVVGGAGVSGNINVGGQTFITNSTATTGVNTGALQVTTGGAYIAGNLWVGGNINFTPNAINTITGNSAQFFGNVAGFGALYAGIPSGYVYQPQTVLQVSSSFNGYAQINNQNIYSGSNASTDYIATADSGNATIGYVDMGINSSGFVNGAGNELNYPLDGYLYAQGTTGTNGNLILGTGTTADIVFTTGGFSTSYNYQGRFKNNVGLILAQTTSSTNTTSGALQVAGGAGIQGAVYAGLGLFDGVNRTVATTTGAGNLTITGNSISLTATGPGATTVGSTTAIPVITTDAYGRISTLTTAALSTSYTLNGTSGTTSVANGSTLSLAGTYGVTVTVGAEYANIATPQDLRTTASPAFTGLQATNFSTGNAVITGGYAQGLANVYATTAQATNFSTGNAVITGGYAQGLANVYATTAQATNFSTGNAVITGGSLNSTPIGATTASTGAFTTLTTSGTAIHNGNIVAASGTSSTSATTGALVVTGGVGVTGNVNIAGNLSVTGTLTYINTTTETVSGIEVVAGNLVANSGTASSSTSTGALVVIGGAGISGAVNSGLGLFDGANRAVATTTGAGNLTITGNSISLTATGPGAVNVGSSTSIPTIATDQYGRVVSLTSNAISIAYTLNGTSGTTSVTNGSTLSLAGTYGVTVTVGTEYANIATPQDLRTTASPSFAGLYSANLSTGNAVISGGSITNTPISGSTGYFTTEQATNFSTANAMITGGTISGVSGGFSTLVTTNFSTANAVITGGHIDGTPVGLYTPSTGAFSTLSATGLATLTGGLSVTNPATFNGNLVAASGTASVSTTTGALVVTGGMGVTGNINVGNTSALHQITGNLLLGSGTAISGALTTLEVNQNTDTPQTSTSVVHVSAKSGQIGKISLDSFGTATPSLMIVRTSSGTSTTPSAVVSGQAIGGFIARGYGSTGYLLNPIGQSNGLVVVTTQNYTDTAQGSQLNLNATPLNSNVATTIMTLNGGGNVTIPASISSTNTSTGALVVVGGVGIGGALNVGTTITASGNIVAASGTSSASTTTGALVVTGGVGVSGSIYAGSLQNTPIGSTTASTAVFTTVSTAGLQAQAIGNVTPGTGAFTTLTTSGTAIHNGNIVAASGTASTSTTTGALVAVGGAGISGNVIAGGQVQAANGLYSTGSFNGGYSDGIIVDYASTNGRISVGSSDSLTFYSGGLAGTQTAQLSSTGVLTVAGNIVASSGTGSTTTTTGALVVVGGAGVSGNINVGGNATVSGASSFNTSQTAGYDHIVKGVNDSTLLWARPATAYDQVLIGNSATVSTLVRGAKLQINSSDSILLPVGTNAQRPSSAGGTDTAGMIRFSTTQNAVEWFNGTSWFSPTTAFTVIADQQFAGTGSQTTFTLNTSQTTASCIVSINGVVQIPTLAYSVSGTTLTFTEAPASTDVIDVRMLTTTVTVTSLSDSTGYNSVLVGSTGVQITTGTSAANVVASYTTTGAYVNGTPNVTVATSGTSTVDTFATNTYSSAEYLVTATISGTSIRQIAKVLVVTDGTNAYVTPYGITSTAGNTLVTFGGTVSSGNVNFQATTTNNNTILRMNKVYQAI